VFCRFPFLSSRPAGRERATRSSYLASAAAAD